MHLDVQIETFYVVLGRRIRARRRELGISQAQLGARLTPTMTRASIANIEAAKQRVLAHTLPLLAHALDVPIDMLTRDEIRPEALTDGESVVAELRDRVGLNAQQLRRFEEELSVDRSAEPIEE